MGVGIYEVRLTVGARRARNSGGTSICTTNGAAGCWCSVSREAIVFRERTVAELPGSALVRREGWSACPERSRRVSPRRTFSAPHFTNDRAQFAVLHLAVRGNAYSLSRYPMSVSRTVSTVAIWICTMIIFVGGVFRLNWDGLAAGFLWAVVSTALAIAPAIATWAVWKSAPQETDRTNNPSDPAQS